MVLKYMVQLPTPACGMDSSVTHTKTTEDFVVLVMQEAEVAQSVQRLGYRLDNQG